MGSRRCLFETIQPNSPCPHKPAASGTLVERSTGEYTAPKNIFAANFAGPQGRQNAHPSLLTAPHFIPAEISTKAGLTPKLCPKILLTT